MSDQTAQTQAGSSYLDQGKKMTLKPGPNPGVKVKAWAVKTNTDATTGRESKYLQITYIHPQTDCPPEEWSEMNELINFPGPKQGETTVNPKLVKMFVSTINSFTQNFVTKEESNARLLAIFAKLGISDFNFEDVSVLSTQLETLVNGFFDLSKAVVFAKEGTLVCGYGAPRTKEGKTVQYLQPMKYGQGGIWQNAFRTSNNTEIPAERTGGFASETEQKYQYWSYTRSTGGGNTSAASSPGDSPVTSKPVDEEKW